MVSSIKQAINRSIKSGTALIASSAAKSHSFRRVKALNSSDPGPSPWLRVDPVMVLRRSFSHNPEGTKSRMSALASETSKSPENEEVERKRSSPVVQRKLSLGKRNKSVAPYVIMDNGLIQL